MRGVTNVWQIILTVTEIAQYRYTAVLCDATNSKFRQLSWKQDYYVAWRIKTLAIYLPPVPQDGIDLVGVFIIAVFDMFAVYNTSVFNTAVLLISVYRSCSGHNAFLGLCEAYKFYRLLLVFIVLLQKSSFQLVITTNGLDHFIIFNYGRIRQTGHVRNTVCVFWPQLHRARYCNVRRPSVCNAEVSWLEYFELNMISRLVSQGISVSAQPNILGIYSKGTPQHFGRNKTGYGKSGFWRTKAVY